MSQVSCLRSQNLSKNLKTFKKSENFLKIEKKIQKTEIFWKSDNFLQILNVFQKSVKIIKNCRIYIYFPLSYYRDIQYNYGSSVSVPGRPSWSRRFLFSMMVRKREATAFCSISHFENICAYSICFSDGLITFFNFGHSIQCICVSSLLKQRGHRLSFWLNDLMLDLIFDNVFDLKATNNDDSSKLS